MRILLVDDSNTMRRIQRNQLNGIGIEDIIEAVDGQDAMAKLHDNMPVDVVILDWNMPVMNGFEFLTQTRLNPAYKDVQIVMCTSESEKSKVMEALKAGANNYIVKPFSPEALKKKLNL